MLRPILVVVVAWCLCGLVVHADVIVYDKAETLVDEYNDLPARFGPQFPLDGLQVFAVMASDVHGCSQLDEPPATRDNSTKFVVLMARNNCTFFEKVMNAERAGYAAAIVYNIDSDDLVEMSGDNNNPSEDAKIPSMFLGYYSAISIKNNYAYDPTMQDFVLVLNRNLPFNINTHLLWPFVAIVVLTFLAMLVITVVRCLRHRNRVARERLPHRELRKLAVIKYNQATCRYDTCSICLDDYEEGERLRVLPCLHTYHTKCVDPWLTKGKRNCPMCKRKIRIAPRRTRRTSSESDSSSGTSAVADTTPLLNATGRGNNSGTMGTFNEGQEQQQQQQPQVQEEARIGFIRRLFSGLFSSRSGSSSTSNSTDDPQNVQVINERENNLTIPATVSAVVDMMSPASRMASVPAPPAVFHEAMPPQPTMMNNPAGLMTTTTPISSPLRNAQAVAQATRASSSESGSGTTPRIGVAALPNVDFQGGGGGGFLPQIQQQPQIGHQHPTRAPQQQQQPNNQSRSNSRHNRRRRRGGGGHEDA